MHPQAVEFFSEFDTHDFVRLEWNDTNQSWANVSVHAHALRTPHAVHLSSARC